MKGTLYALTRTKEDIDEKQRFKLMLTEVSETGAVVIDGANIAADSIYTRHLRADTIIAEHIKSGEIKTDHLAAGSINADRLTAHTITSAMIHTEGLSANVIKTGKIIAGNNVSVIDMANGEFSLGGGKLGYVASTNRLYIGAGALFVGELPIEEHNRMVGSRQSAETQKIAITNEKQALDARYTSLYGNVNLTGTPKTDLAIKYSNATTGYTTRYDSLEAALNAVIVAPTNTTITAFATLQTAVTTATSNYTTAVFALNTALELATKTIENAVAAKAQADATAAAALDATTKAGTAETNAKTHADTKVNSIEIGGRNLFIDTINYVNPTYWSAKGAVEFATEKYLGASVTKVNSAWANRCYKISTLSDLVSDSDYTISFMVKADFDSSSYPTANKLYAYGLTAPFSSIEICDWAEVTTAWRKFSFTVKGEYIDTSSDVHGFRIESNTTLPATKYFYFSGYTLEKGNKATDWTPAPEDIQSQIDTSVSTTDVEYYLSTSSTSLSGGSWVTTAPAWMNGKYMWSRTKVVLNNGTPTYKPSANGTCIAGATGSIGATGSTGATGKGITSITEEYYLSTSKTSQVGGSWVTTPPTWSTGKYMWTRSKIVYNNPTSTVDTTAVVDSSWEAVNEIKIGGRNLVKESGISVTNASYDLKTLRYGDKWLEAGKQYTITAKFQLGADRTELAFFSSGGWECPVRMTSADRNADGICSKTFTMSYSAGKTPAEGFTYLTAYQMPNTGTTNSTLEWVKIEEGNKATDWSPAPEDVVAQIETKARTFTSTPVVPYNSGDIWRNGTSVYVCSTPRNTGSFLLSEWTLTADTTTAQRLNEDPAVTRVTGRKLHFTDQVLMDNAWIEKLVANSIIATKIQATDISATRITSGTISADRIAAGSLSGNKITANTIDATRLSIGSGAQGGYINNPRFDAWTSTYPDGTDAWGVGGISKVSVDTVWMAQFSPTAGSMQGMTLSPAYFANGVDLDGMQYFTLECRFRLTAGSNPSGACFLVDVYRKDASFERMHLDMAEAGTTLTTGSWYVARKVFKLSDYNVAKTFSAVAGYLLANYSGSGDATKTIQFASVNMFQASAQEYLTQSWTGAGTTSINGGMIATGTLSADKITTGVITAGNGVSTIDMSTGAFSFGSGKIAFDGTTLSLNVDSLKITNSSVATQTYADAKINSIEIGGRNLLRNTSNPTGYENLSDGSSSYSSIYADSIKGNVFERATTGTGGNYIWTSRTDKVEVSTEYTFSCDLWVNEPVSGVDLFWLSDTDASPQGGAGYVNVTASTTISHTDNVWQRVIWTFTTKANDRTGVIRIDNNGSKVSGTNAILRVTNLKLEKGNKATDWTPAPEDVAYDIEQKADSAEVAANLNIVSTAAAQAKSIADAKLNKNTYDDFVKEYSEYKTVLAAEQSVASGNLQAAQTAVASIQKEMGDMKESWMFNNGTKIEATPNGMLISDGNPSGMNMLLSQNRLSFFDGGVEVAYIADKTMKINNGIFVKSAQIGSHLISTSPANSDITIVSFVGEG